MKTLELYVIEVEGVSTLIVRATGPAAAKEFARAHPSTPEGATVKAWHLEDDGREGVIMASVDGESEVGE